MDGWMNMKKEGNEPKTKGGEREKESERGRQRAAKGKRDPSNQRLRTIYFC